MMKIPSALSNAIQSFDPVLFQEKHRPVIQFLFGITVCKFLDHYLKNNFSIVKYNRYYKTQTIAQTVNVLVAALAVKHYSHFEPHYLQYAKTFGVSAKNTFTIFGALFLGAKLGMVISKPFVASLQKKEQFNEIFAERLRMCGGALGGILALSYSAIRYPVHSLSAQQACWMAITCLAVTIIGNLYHSDSIAYKAKYALISLTGGGVVVWGAETSLKFLRNK